MFVDPEIAVNAVNGDRIVQEEEVEICPKKFSASCFDENVCLKSTAKYCSKDAWMAVKSFVDTLQKMLFTIVGDPRARMIIKCSHQ